MRGFGGKRQQGHSYVDAPPRVNATEEDVRFIASMKVHDEVHMKEAHLVQYDEGEWHQLEALLEDAVHTWRLNFLEASRSRDKAQRARAYEYSLLEGTFKDALDLLRKGRHV